MTVIAGAFGLEPLYFSSGVPSNFYRAPILMRNPFSGESITFDTNEHYFQAMKVSLCRQGTAEMFLEIAGAASAMNAKQLGRQVPLSDDELRAWDDVLSVQVMLACNIAKYGVHLPCQRWLVETGIRPLIEHRPDPIWGDNMDGTGRNLLGKTLELVRALVR